MISIDVSVPQFEIDEPGSDLLIEVADSIIESISDRIGKDHLSSDLIQLEPNDPGWRDYKVEHGFSGHPLVMKGELTSKDAWDRMLGGGDFNELFLNYDNQKKWDSILDYAYDRVGWERAFNVSVREIEAVKKSLDKYLKANGINKLIKTKVK